MADHIKNHNEEVIRTGKISAQEEVIEDLTTKELKYYTAVKAPLYDENGKVIGVVGTSIDITDKKFNEQKLQAANQLAIKAAHDIRSPLVALNMIVNNVIQDIPEKARIMIKAATQQINDIANNLLAVQRQECENKEHKENRSIQPELIWTLLDSIISEKRVQYINHATQFIFNVAKDGHNAFACINAPDFRRMISNLINNAVEAIKEAGQITVHLNACPSNLTIEIEDNGCGMSTELIEKALIGGVSVGKEAGYGIGLSSAKKIIEGWDGKLNIQSKPQVGTKIVLSLPKTPYASWFMPELALTKKSTIVVIDDDQSIHDVWQTRWESELKRLEIKIIHLYSPEEALTAHFPPQAHYLIDYEFIGSKRNGLDLIQALCLTGRATLVTSHYDELAIRNRCHQLGVRILPKNYAIYIPFKIV